MHIYTHMDVHIHRSCTRCNFSQHVSADAHTEKNKWIICWCRVTSRCLFLRAEELVNVSPDPVASSPVSFHTRLSWDTQQANLLENPAFSWGARLRWVVRIAVPCFARGVHWQRASSAVLCPLACAPRARSFSKDPSVLAAHICHRSSPERMAGESYLLVVTSFAVSLNSDAENSGCSPAPRSVIDVVAAEGRGRSHEKCVLILLCHFFFVVSNFWNASSKKG